MSLARLVPVVLAIAGCTGVEPVVIFVTQPPATETAVAPTPTATPTATPMPPTPSPASGTPAGFTRYDGRDGSFSIAIPENWALEPIAIEGHVFVAVSPLDSIVTVARFVDALEDTDLASSVNENRRFLERIYETRSQLTEATVAGNPALRLQFTEDGVVGTRTHMLYTWAVGDDQWTIEFWVQGTEPDPVFDEILATFEVG